MYEAGFFSLQPKNTSGDLQLGARLQAAAAPLDFRFDVDTRLRQLSEQVVGLTLFIERPLE